MSPLLMTKRATARVLWRPGFPGWQGNSRETTHDPGADATQNQPVAAIYRFRLAGYVRHRSFHSIQMAKMMKSIVMADEVIITKICLIRGRKVLLDRDLAELNGVETKQLKRQVKRNLERFPDDFMFELSDTEFQEWRGQFGTSNEGDKMGLRYAPYAFTGQGVAMLSGVLNSDTAIGVNIQIHTDDIYGIEGTIDPIPGAQTESGDSEDNIWILCPSWGLMNPRHLHGI